MLHQFSIARRTRDLAGLIENHYREQAEIPLMLVTSMGAWIFAADLLRQVNVPHEVDIISASSYVGGRRTDHLKIAYAGIRIKDRTILIIEDIVDSGNTLLALIDYCIMNGADNIRSVSLLQKGHTKRSASWVGFEIEDQFVFGYGMDDELGLNRSLPDIYVRDAP